MEQQHSPEATSPSQNQSSANEIVEGQRYGQLIRLKPQYEEQYVALHAHPFPGLIEELRAANLHNYSIFLRDNVLFSFYEYSGTDYEKDMQAMASDSTVKDWWTLTDQMQKSLSPDESDQWWVVLEELFRAGDKELPSREATKRAFVQTLSEDQEDTMREALSELEPQLREAVEGVGVQNFAVYKWQDRLYTYYECTTGDRACLDRLHSCIGFQRLRRRVGASRSTEAMPSDGNGTGEEEPERGLNQMESVFYME